VPHRWLDIERDNANAAVQAGGGHDTLSTGRENGRVRVTVGDGELRVSSSPGDTRFDVLLPAPAASATEGPR